MPKKPRYTIEQHVALGKELQTIQERLTKIHRDLFESYPAKLADLIRPADNALIKLRQALENEVYKENPGWKQDRLNPYLWAYPPSDDQVGTGKGDGTSRT